MRLRVKHRGLPFGLLLGWMTFAIGVIVIVPAALRFGVPFWTLPPGRIVQLYVPAAAYLMYTLVLVHATRQGREISILLAVVLGAGCFVVFYMVLLHLPGILYSRPVGVVAGALGMVLALLPFLARPRQSVTLGIIFAAASIGSWMAYQAFDRPTTKMVRSSALYPLQLTVHAGLAGRPLMDGGAIERFDDAFILVTGDGDFYLLRRSRNGRQLSSARLPLRSPLLERNIFLADQNGLNLRLRVTDLLIEKSHQGSYLVVAHQAWSRTKKCFSMRVSRARLPDIDDGTIENEDPWETVFDTRPCLTAEPYFDDIETGGRLAWDRSGRILFTVGDHGFDGLASAPLAQQADADYGKVLLLDLEGGAEVISAGHRNPQGLLVDRLGQAWITEHGPQGGDELNLLVPGANYGWPLATYGTKYNQYWWPLAPNSKNHGDFTEPVHAFVPSIAISNVIQIDGREFSKWQDDFLVGSLRMRTLYRLRMRHGRISYVEPILVGYRIRDLVEGSDGRVLLWSDDGNIIDVTRQNTALTGETMFEQCRACHEPSSPQAISAAPSLRGIVGSEIASRTDFQYSDSLKELDGIWTAAKLDQFLQNPQLFAPGNNMRSSGVTDSAERKALIDYLKSYR